MIYLKDEKDLKNYLASKNKSAQFKKSDRRKSKSLGFKYSAEKRPKSTKEAAICALLTKWGIKFRRECGFEVKCKILFFDFYIPCANLIIEYDGSHHFEPVYGTDEFSQCRHNDKVKENYANSKGLNILRIPCHETRPLSEVLKEHLSRYII